MEYWRYHVPPKFTVRLIVGMRYWWESRLSRPRMSKSFTSMLVLNEVDRRKIKENQYEFPATNPVSDEAKDMITSLLCPDPHNRPSIDEISDHKFFHSGELPREIPVSTLEAPPVWEPISKPMSELNWRFLSVQAGLGKNVQVGQDAGKSVQACIAVNEHALKGHVARLQQEQGVVAKELNVLPMTLSPRVPAPAIGGPDEGRLMGKTSRRSLRKGLVGEDDKENELPKAAAGSLKRKLHVAKKRPSVKEAFEGIPEEPVEEPVKPRRMAPPERKPGGNILKISTSQPPALSSSGSVPTEQSLGESQASGAKRTLRGARSAEPLASLPAKVESNVHSKVLATAQTQRAILKRTTGQDNLRQVISSSHLPNG